MFSWRTARLEETVANQSIRETFLTTEAPVIMIVLISTAVTQVFHERSGCVAEVQGHGQVTVFSHRLLRSPNGGVGTVGLWT